MVPVNRPHVTRVNGPLVEIANAAGAAMGDMVALGPNAVPAEIVAIRAGQATAQAYEYTGGLVPGHPVTPQGHPLAARLGPALLGGVFDGLLRPLATAEVFLSGTGGRSDGPPRRWEFTPHARPGDRVRAGDVLGVLGPAAVEHRVLVPPGVAGVVETVAPPGPHTDDDELVVVSGTPVHAAQLWPVRLPRPCRSRSSDVVPLTTGQRVLDLLFPLPRGGTAAVPGGFGTGKTMLLQQIAKWCAADVIVYVGCGERGNEMAEVVADLATLPDPRTGGRIIDRTVVIANTSNMPMMAREASVHTGITVAEFFRDMGHDAVVIADSTSRWAEALREFASRNGDLPTEEGYPADLASALAAFYERAGIVTTLGGATGSVTVVGAVSPPGGDLTEPVTAATERFVRCRWSLDKDLAYARHYPAVSWSASFARDVDALGGWYSRSGDPDWAPRRTRLAALLAEADALAAIAELVGATALSDRQRVAIVAGGLARDVVLQQNSLSANDAHCSPAKTAALVDALLATVDALEAAVTAGVGADALERLDFGPLTRARDESGPDDPDAVPAIRDAILDQIGQARP